MKLSTLIHTVSHSTNQFQDVEVTGLCNDSRKIEKGNIFFAIPGYETNGTIYIKEALKGGASSIIHEDENLKNKSFPYIYVKNVRQALSFIAKKFFKISDENFIITGITGTNGKTTLTYLLEKLNPEKNSAVIGTINVRYGEKSIPATHTTPDILTLYNHLRDFDKNEVENIFMEISSHALSQRRVEGLNLNCAIFTNLTQDHLDYHQTMEDYYNAKKTLFTEYLHKSHKKNKLAIINIDNPYGKKLYQEISGENFKRLSTSINNSQADLYALETTYTISGTTAKLYYKPKRKEIILKSNLIGNFNLQNLMSALAYGLYYQIAPLENILESLSKINIPGRLERISKNYFVDYAHTPDALENVLKTLMPLTIQKEQNKSRIITVFGCGGDRDKTKRPIMGECAARYSDIAIVTSDNPRTENPESIIKNIMEGIEGQMPPFSGDAGYIIEIDRKKAIQQAIKLAKENDIILVAGKGHEDYQIIGTKKSHFDDSEVIKSCL